MAKVRELQPGCIVKLGNEQATFIASEPHPKFPKFLLVIWKTQDGEWSLDALDPRQEVGEVLPYSAETRWNNIQEAFGRA